MSRSGYSDDCENLQLWRGAVERAIKGQRGQAFLKEMLIALDSLPQKRLIAHELIEDGEVCAIGSVGLMRGIDMTKLNVEYPDHIGAAFGIATSMVQEIEFMNDDDFSYGPETTPEKRWESMRKWVLENIFPIASPSGTTK